MNSKDHGHDMGHFIGGFVELHGSLVGVQQIDKSFRTLEQFEVVLYRDHEEFIDVDIDHLHGSKNLEGSIEYFVDEDEQLCSYEYSYFLRVVVQLVCDQLEQIHLSADLNRCDNTC